MEQQSELRELLNNYYLNMQEREIEECLPTGSAIYMKKTISKFINFLETKGCKLSNLGNLSNSDLGSYYNILKEGSHNNIVSDLQIIVGFLLFAEDRIVSKVV